MMPIRIKLTHVAVLMIILLLGVSPHDAASQSGLEGGSEVIPSIPKKELQKFTSYQTSKSSWYFGLDFAVGLGVRASSSSYADATAFVDFGVTPKLGYFLLDRGMAGISVDMLGLLVFEDANDTYKVHAKTWGPFFRYYSRKGIFCEMQYGIGKAKEISANDEIVEEYKYEVQRYSMGLGFASFWSKNFNFEMLLKYNNAWGNIQDIKEVSIASLSLTAGIGFSIGK